MAHQIKRIATLAALIGGGLLGSSVIRRLREYDLRNKVVLITGGSRGLGLVLARQFAKEGAQLAICARDKEELSRAKDDLNDRGARVIAMECDVTVRSEVDELIEHVGDYYGRIDVLVNNAGTIEVGPIEVMTPADFEVAMDTHFWGPVYAAFAVIPQMRARRSGRIINISSIGGKLAVPHLTPYCASKFALAGFSEGLSCELRKDGISVTTVYPGLMRTGSARNATFKGQHRAEYALFSLGAALPLTSMSAERAAKQIIRASKQGRAEIVLSIQAELALLFHKIFPEASTELMSAVNALLPGPGGIGKEKAKGKESSSILAPSILTTLNDRAAVRNNEMNQ